MFEIRAGREDDKGQILELIRDVYGEAEALRAERRWHWQWHEDPRLENPGYRGAVTEWEGRIIGTLSFIPGGLYVAGEPVPSVWLTDSIVHWGRLRQALKEQKRRKDTPPQAFPYGISCAMMEHPSAGGTQLAKHITDNMFTIGVRIGFQHAKGLGSWSRLVSFRQPLESALGKPLGFLLGWLADGFVPRIPKSSLTVNTLEGDFDARFDALWKSARQDYPAITRRDSAVLNWRYRRHPDTAYTVLTVEDGGGLLGYLAYSVFFRHGQRRAHIVDILARHGHAEAFSALLAEAVRLMRREQVHKVECYGGGDALLPALKRCGFAQRSKKGKDHPTMVRGLPDVELHVTRGDGDGG